MRFKFVTSLVLVAIFSATSCAQTVLVDRSPDPDLLGGGIIGGFFSDQAVNAVSTLTEVTLTETVTLGAVTVFTTNLNGTYPVGSTSSAILNIFVGDTLDSGDNTLSGGDLGSASATADYVATADGIEITVSGLDITMPATTYLIGITPVLDFATNGQEFFLDAGANGETTFLNNPGGLFFVPIFGTETINANILDLPTPFSGQAIRLTAPDMDVLKGDVNGDGSIDLLDVGPFVDAIGGGVFVPAADVDCNGVVNLLDVDPFIDLLNGG